MDKFVSQLLWYNSICRSTANASALNRLAGLLEKEKYEEFRTLIAKLDGKLKIREGSHSSVGNDMTISLPKTVYPILAQRLRDLATSPEHERLFLSEIDQLSREHTEHNWSIERVEYQPEPERDYTPDPDGAMWDAALFCEMSNADVLEAAWNDMLSWSGPSERYDDYNLRVDYSGEVSESEMHAAREAFKILASGLAPTGGTKDQGNPYMAIGYRPLPLKKWYGEGLDWLQVWFEEDRILLIVADRHAQTGCVDWDLKNFFIYHALIVAISKTVNATRFAWWQEADNAEYSDAIPIEKLEDTDTLWRLIMDMVYVERPLNRSKFDAAFAEHIKSN